MKLSDMISTEVWTYTDSNIKFSVVAEKIGENEDKVIFKIDDSIDDYTLLESKTLSIRKVSNMAKDSIKKYYSAKFKYTTHFFAHELNDRKFYDKVVNDLMKTGNYKLLKNRWVDGGRLWVLQHKDTTI